MLLLLKAGRRSLRASNRLCTPAGRSRVLVPKWFRLESAAWVAESPITLPEADDCWDVSKQLLSQILTHDDLTFLLRSAEIPYSMGALLTFIAHVLMLPRSRDQWGSDLRGISHFFITVIMFLWINKSFFFLYKRVPTEVLFQSDCPTSG